MFKKVIKKEKSKKLESLADIIDSIFNKFETKISSDEVIKKYSDTIDNFIIKTEKENNINYVGGKFKMNLTEKYLVIVVECYFQNEKREWIKKYSENNIDVNRIDEVSLQRLKKQEKIEFDIENPEKIS